MVSENSSLRISLNLIISDSDDESESVKKFKFCQYRNSKKWYVLTLYCLSSFSQVIVWNTWSPIANSALYAFPSWHENTIALLNNWGCIMFLGFIIPCCWLLNEKGLRISLVLANFLCMLGSGVRLLSSEEELFTILAHVGAMLNSIGGVLLSPSIVLLSSTWFPSNQRTSATGIGTSLSLLGIAGSYLLGPLIVKEPPQFQNEEQIERDRFDIRHEISLLLFICFAIELVLFLLLVITFPEKPKVPPSKSSILRMTEEIPFFASIKMTLSNSEFWKLSLASGFCSGISGPWLSLLTIIFEQTGITQSETAKLGFWTIVCSCLMGLSVSKMSDYCPKHIRLMLLMLIGFGDFMFIWILLLTTGTIPFKKGNLMMVVIGGLSAVWSSPALFYELGAELTYPIQEGIVAGCMMAVNNFCACLVYLQLYLFPEIDVSWMNYGLLIFGLLSLLLLLVLNEDYKRTSIDRN